MDAPAATRPFAPSGPESGPAPEGHPPIVPAGVAALLVNLGTPDAPTPRAVRRYLKEFLSDPRVVDLPRLIWLPVLNGVILNTRPRKTAENYAKVWLREEAESPLRHYTRAQAEALEARFDGSITVDFAMRYGEPRIEDRLRALMAAGARRIVIVPLYPQYSATTTASAVDAVSAALSAMRWQPAIRIAPPFHDDAAYIEALAARTRETLSQLAEPPERIVISFHGIPERYFRAGDPYHCHCQKTARLLRELMGWPEDYADIAFQSRFGPEEWLGPSLEETLIEAAEDGVKRIAVIAPAFISDCIETLEEIDIAGRETFLSHGGDAFTYIPCLNDHERAIECLEPLIAREAAGWI